MPVHKGGRGQKAPYESTHVRVPVPIKDRVQEMVDLYKNGLLKDNDDLEAKANANPLLSLEEAATIARDILKQKKSAKVSLAKLLTAIYGEEIEL